MFFRFFDPRLLLLGRHVIIRAAVFNLVCFYCWAALLMDSPELQEEHHEVVVPALLACIDPNNGGCPRVLHRALLTLAVVVEACPEGGVMSHAEALLERYCSTCTQWWLRYRRVLRNRLSRTRPA